MTSGRLLLLVDDISKPGFLLWMALAGTMVFIAGTTCPDRITVRHRAMVLTVIDVIDTQ